MSGANPLQLAVSAAGREAARRIERAQVQTSARADEARATIDELEREIEELESGVHPTPPAPYTRGADAREHRAGAPLWQLVDFRHDLAGRRSRWDRGGARGIGDPRRMGQPVRRAARSRHRRRAAGRHAAELARGPQLADALVPAIDAAVGVSEADVHGLLIAIGLGESDDPTWVSAGGRYRNGVLRGAWHKATATFIGHTAREAARHARLAELHDRAAAARVELDAREQQLAGLARRHADLERELTELPSDAAVRNAGSALAAADAELASLAQRLDGARAQEQRAHGAEQEAGGTLHTDAADLGLPTGVDELAEVQAALGQLRETLAALWPAILRRERAEHVRARATNDVRAAAAERAETAGRLTEAGQQLDAAAERRDTLQATAGAAIAELERQLGETAQALTTNEAVQRSTEEQVGEARRAEGAAEALGGELRQQLDVATDARLSAVDGLRRFATTGLIAVALPETEVLDPGRGVEHHSGAAPGARDRAGAVRRP